MSQQVGLIAEQQARNYLVSKGLRWITSNYRCRWGEIDLIMGDGITLVFVEVRARVSAEFGGAIGSITLQKQKRIIKTATHYLTTKNLYNTCNGRFDVISIQGATSQIEWIKNAFGMDY